MGGSGQPLICDFGISRKLDYTLVSLKTTPASGSSEPTRGTLVIMAPELLDPNRPQTRYTYETDVWAFGMTIYVSSR